MHPRTTTESITDIRADRYVEVISCSAVSPLNFATGKPKCQVACDPRSPRSEGRIALLLFSRADDPIQPKKGIEMPQQPTQQVKRVDRGPVRASPHIIDR
jgi:hypothetical protein